MRIETYELDANSSIDVLKNACLSATKNSKPVAVLVKKNTFTDYQRKTNVDQSFEMSREDAIKIIAEKANKFNYSIVSTTGVASRELFEYREHNKQTHANDFLTVGGMGHAAQIALGLGMFSKRKNILCLDGDGAFLMHMGSNVEAGIRSIEKFKHILINNRCHDSVGGQPTRAGEIELMQVAKAFGYKVFTSCNSKHDLEDRIDEFLACKECAFLEINVKSGFRSNLGRPTTTPAENKILFMQTMK